MKYLFVALLALAMLPAPVLAGGGNKNSTNVRVRNNSQGDVAVLFDNGGTANADLVNITQAQFRNRGGFILNGGETRTINLRSGNHVIRAAYLGNNNRITDASLIGTANVRVRNNQTSTVDISGDNTAAAQLQVTNNQ